MISTHTPHKTQKKKYTHEVKVNKKKARRSKQLKQTSKKRNKTRSREEDKKQYLPSSSSQLPANSFPTPRPPSVPRRKLLARTNSPPPKTREKENERRESHSRATPSHTHTQTHTCKHFKVNTYLACANSYCHSGREICDFFHTHTQASKLNLNGACSFFSVFHTFTHMHRILVSLSLI